MSCTRKIKIENTIYTANTDFRIAIECNNIAKDTTIGDFERALAIIYIIFGEQGLNNENHYDRLLKWSLNFLSCGQQIQDNKQKPDMDYNQDMDYIEASFMSDYKIDLENTQMDWWKFNKLINGLSNSEFGDCCILNRVRNLRNFDTSKIKNSKEREKIIKAKKQVELKQEKKEIHLTKNQEESMERLNKILGI